MLDLQAVIYPCPKGGTRFRDRVKRRGGKLQFPYLIDPNTDRLRYYRLCAQCRARTEHFGSGIAIIEPPLPFENFDKLYHLLEYGVLGLLLVRALRAGARLTAATGAAAVVLGVLIGGADEFFQRGIPGRRSSALDWITDAAGVLLALLLYARLTRARAGTAS